MLCACSRAATFLVRLFLIEQRSATLEYFYCTGTVQEFALFYFVVSRVQYVKQKKARPQLSRIAARLTCMRCVAHKGSVSALT